MLGIHTSAPTWGIWKKNVVVKGVQGGEFTPTLDAHQCTNLGNLTKTTLAVKGGQGGELNPTLGSMPVHQLEEFGKKKTWLWKAARAAYSPPHWDHGKNPKTYLNGFWDFPNDPNVGQSEPTLTNAPFGWMVQWMGADFLSFPVPVPINLDQGS